MFLNTHPNYEDVKRQYTVQWVLSIEVQGIFANHVVLALEDTLQFLDPTYSYIGLSASVVFWYFFVNNKLRLGYGGKTHLYIFV